MALGWAVTGSRSCRQETGSGGTPALWFKFQLSLMSCAKRPGGRAVQGAREAANSPGMNLHSLR